MKNSWSVPLIGVVALFMLIGFTITVFKKSDKPRMVVVLKQLNDEYWKTIQAGAEKAFDDYNIDGEVIAPHSEYSSEKQLVMLKIIWDIFGALKGYYY